MNEHKLRSRLTSPHRIEVLHGANLDTLGARNPLIYGTTTLPELEIQIKHWATELGLDATFFQTNMEGEFIEYLHRIKGMAGAVILNPGAWTHYSYAIRDALELTELPAVEVHLSDISKREEWRKQTVFGDVENLIGRVYGKGPDGYREALELIAAKLG